MSSLDSVDEVCSSWNVRCVLPNGSDGRDSSMYVRRVEDSTVNSRTPEGIVIAVKTWVLSPLDGFDLLVLVTPSWRLPECIQASGDAVSGRYQLCAERKTKR